MSRGAFGVTYMVMQILLGAQQKMIQSLVERPLTNRPGYPNDSLPFSSAYYWDVRTPYMLDQF